jgi:hypothetical protein
MRSDNTGVNVAALLHVQRDASTVVEYGRQFEVGAEGFDVSPHCWHGWAFAPFYLGY